MRDRYSSGLWEELVRDDSVTRVRERKSTSRADVESQSLRIVCHRVFVLLDMPAGEAAGSAKGCCAPCAASDLQRAAMRGLMFRGSRLSSATMINHLRRAGPVYTPSVYIENSFAGCLTVHSVPFLAHSGLSCSLLPYSLPSQRSPPYPDTSFPLHLMKWYVSFTERGHWLTVSPPQGSDLRQPCYRRLHGRILRRDLRHLPSHQQ